MAMRQYVRDSKGQFAETPGGGLASRLVGEWRDSTLTPKRRAPEVTFTPIRGGGGTELGVTAPGGPVGSVVKNRPLYGDVWIAYLPGRRGKGALLEGGSVREFPTREAAAEALLAERDKPPAPSAPAPAAPSDPPRSGDVLAERLRGEMGETPSKGRTLLLMQKGGALTGAKTRAAVSDAELWELWRGIQAHIHSPSRLAAVEKELRRRGLL